MGKGGTDLRPVLKAWSILFTVAFMPGVFSRMVYHPGESAGDMTQWLADANIALAIVILMMALLPILWFMDRIFAVIPSKNQCYAMVIASIALSYMAGYLAQDVILFSLTIFASAIGTVTICVLKRYAWYVDDLWIFSVIASK
jgi:hypothetical protein